MRKKIIAANWKMNMTQAESAEFVHSLLLDIGDIREVDVVIIPPFTAIAKVTEALGKAQNIKVGAQNMHWEKFGAYTGAISPQMLVDAGVQDVIVGHSERRQYFNETDESVNLKLKAALAHSLIPIVCVGEHREERESGQTNEVLKLQVEIALEGIDAAAAAPLVIAYEPVWAIGTGLTATPEMAAEAHKFIRAEIAKALGAELAASTRILYGGSVKPDNAAALCALEDIDGALVGGASLDPKSFHDIIRNGCA